MILIYDMIINICAHLRLFRQIPSCNPLLIQLQLQVNWFEQCEPKTQTIPLFHIRFPMKVDESNQIQRMQFLYITYTLDIDDTLYYYLIDSLLYKSGWRITRLTVILIPIPKRHPKIKALSIILIFIIILMTDIILNFKLFIMNRLSS